MIKTEEYTKEAEFRQQGLWMIRSQELRIWSKITSRRRWALPKKQSSSSGTSDVLSGHMRAGGFEGCPDIPECLDKRQTPTRASVRTGHREVILNRFLNC
jgi:hypothetical protein